MDFTLLYASLAVLFAVTGITTASKCSPGNRTINLDACLADVRTAVLDTDEFWFGSSYITRCPLGPATDFVLCSNKKPSSADSIASRLFPNQGSERANGIDRYLDMTFTSEPGQYTACGNTFTVNSSWTANMDPTQTILVKPWLMRNVPEMTWTYTEGEYYTLIVYDIGNFFNHGFYINIPGNDIASADAIDPYHGPLASEDKINAYVFVLFRQQGRLTLTSQWLEKITTANYTILEFVAATNVIGPVAMNWITANGDVYAAGEMESLGILHRCPLNVAKEMDKKSRPFLPNPASLSVSIDIQFSPTYLSHYLCCTAHEYSQKTFSLNPLGNALFSTADTRSEASPSVTFKKQGLLFMSSNFQGNTYTLVMVDPDVPYPAAGIEERPLLHMMVVNIQNGDIATGEVVQSYMGPAPPDNKPHYYYFLLYEQQTTLDAAKMTSYTGDSCFPSIEGRCLFNINQAVSDNNLQLVGATWMLADTDDYVIYNQVLSDPSNVNSICRGYPGYDNPCPVGASSGLSSPFWFILSSALGCTVYQYMSFKTG